MLVDLPSSLGCAHSPEQESQSPFTIDDIVKNLLSSLVALVEHAVENELLSLVVALHLQTLNDVLLTEWSLSPTTEELLLIRLTPVGVFLSL